MGRYATPTTSLTTPTIGKAQPGDSYFSGLPGEFSRLLLSSEQVSKLA